MLKLYVSLVNFKARAVARFRQGLEGEEGSTVAEYALVLVLVTVAVIGVLGDLGDALREKIIGITESIQAGNP